MMAPISQSAPETMLLKSHGPAHFHSLFLSFIVPHPDPYGPLNSLFYRQKIAVAAQTGYTLRLLFCP